MTALFLVMSHAVVRHILSGYDPEDRWFAVLILAVLTPVTAGLGLAMTQLWAWVVEMLRLRNFHISYRAARLPVSAAQHGWSLWGVAMAIFAAVAATTVVRGRERSGRTRIRF